MELITFYVLKSKLKLTYNDKKNAARIGSWILYFNPIWAKINKDER